MHRFLSTAFGFLAGVIGIAVLANQFIVHARPLTTSVLWSILATGSLFAVSVAFDRFDARSRGIPATRILPSRRGVWSFIFCVFAMSVMVVIFGLPSVIATQLPTGDSWSVAAIRLTFLVMTVVIGVLVYVTALSFSEWFFQDKVFDDLYQSFGRSLSWREHGSANNTDVPSWVLLAILVAAVGVLLDGHQLLAPFAEAVVNSKRGRKMQMVLHWILEHPRTMRLHAGALIAICVTWLGVKAVVARRCGRVRTEDVS